MRTFAYILCAFSLLLYSVSFFLDTYAIRVDGKEDVSNGFDAFLAAFLSPFFVFSCTLWWLIAWLANPALWYGTYCLVSGRDGRAVAAGGAGFGCCIIPSIIIIGNRSRG